MRALVTGGAGFTGTHLVDGLLTAGHEVTVLDISRGDSASTAQAERRGARFVVGSLDDDAALESCVPGHDVVFNLASAFRDIHEGSPLFQRVDVEGTRKLLAQAQRAGVRRVVHCSTQGVHGTLKSEAPGDETSPIAPIDYYCQAKMDAEKVCDDFIARGLDVVKIRPASIYGPGDTHGWLKLFRTCRSGRFLMLGSGETFNHPVFVENLVAAFLRAAEVPEARGQTYLIGDDRCVTLNELVHLVGRVQGIDVRVYRFPWIAPAHLVAWLMEIVSRPLRIEPPIFRRRLTWFTTNRCWRISKAERELGYKPHIGLEEGLRKTLEWYQSRGLI